MIYRSLATVCMAAFYITYIAKMLLLRKRGILTDKTIGKKDGKALISEIILKVIMIIVPLVETISLIMGRSYLPIMGKVIGVYFGITAVILLLFSLTDMKTAWNPGKEKRKLVTGGIYSFSRNPSFLAFDLLYIGIALMYCNVFTIVLSLFAAVFFHIRILDEERFLKEKYGGEYEEYKKRVSRYYGFGKIGFKQIICALYLLLVIWSLYYVVTLVCYAGIFLSWIWIWFLIGGFALVRFIMLKRDIDGVSKFKIPIPVRIIYYVLFSISLAVFIFFECNIFISMNAVPKDDLEYVIVLGAGVNGETPSIPLVKRIDEGYDYMVKNPDTILIASGGKGFMEDISEAECIKRELVKKGLSEDRIILEDRSTSTIENLKYSLEIIGDPDAEVGIITNSFHEYRAGLIAEKAGFENASSVPAITLFPVGIHYMVREFFGIVRFLMD